MSNDEKYIEGYVGGSLLPDYNDYCPLLLVCAVLQDNGLYRIADGVEVERCEIKPNPGFLIVQFGGAHRDHTLDSAARSVYQSLHSLFSGCGDSVDLEVFRTTVELSEFMKIYRCNYSHVVFIGHGSEQGIPFLDKNSPVAGAELSGMLGVDEHRNELQIISFCCHSGCERLSSALNSSAGISEVIAPNGSFDMRWCSYFITGLYLSVYVTGLAIDDGIAVASKTLEGMEMCTWRNGSLVECGGSA